MNIKHFLFAISAHAQSATPTLPISGQQISLTRLIELINQVARFMIQIAPVFAVIFIVWGGITYMAAGPDPEKTARAKTRLKNAIIGTFVIFGVGLILSTISGFLNNLTLYQ